MDKSLFPILELALVSFWAGGCILSQKPVSSEKTLAETAAINFSAGDSTRVGSGRTPAEEPPPEDCTAGVADGDVTIDGRPLLWKMRNETYGVTELDNDLHYFAPGEVHYPGIEPATYSYLGMGPEDDFLDGPVRQGLNSQGLAVGFNLFGDSGWQLLHHQALSHYNSVNQVRDYVNEMASLSTFNYFIDIEGEAALWENLIGLDDHWEYNTRAPARDDQWIDVDNADSDNRYDTGTDVSLSGWVVRANQPAHFKADGTDDLDATDRYKVGRDVVGSLIYNNGLGTALSAKQLATNFFRNDALISIGVVSNMIVQGVLSEEDPGLSTMWVLLGQSKTGIFVPVWIHGIESGETPHVPQYLDSVDDISVYTPARGMYDADFNQTNVQARTLPFEGHLFDVVNDRLLPDWRNRDWTDVAIISKIGEEMRRVQEQMDADAYWHLNYLFDHGSASNYAPTVSIDSVSYNGLEAIFSVITNDADDDDTLTSLCNYGDGQTGSDGMHKYTQGGHYLVSCTVTDNHGVSQTDWLFVTVEVSEHFIYMPFVR